MEIFLEEAFRVAVLTEKNSLDFYRRAAAKVHDGRGKQVLEQLANQETEHVEEILSRYSGVSLNSLLRLIELPNYQNPPVFDGYFHKIDTQMTERHALGLALSQEQSCMDRYEVFVATFREPKVRKVFEQALHMSRKQYEVLEEKFRQLAPHHDRAGQDVVRTDLQ
jgi:erythrin-vacuolar iron transport family protein